MHIRTSIDQRITLESTSVFKRDWCYYGSCSPIWSWARWIVLAFLLIVFSLLIVSTIRVNRRRRQQGRLPITGTSWLTPPSYTQTQQQQQQPYVPQYTEQANPNDAGYYDNQGNFHANPFSNKVLVSTQAVHLDNLVPDQTGVSQPGVATSTNVTSRPVVVDGFSRDFSAHYNGTTNAGSSSTSNDVVFQRPNGPPPSAHLKN